MKTIFTISMLLIAVITHSQVGIGTVAPDDSSILDITATDKGILIPRMTLAQRDLITAPAEGLLIYQIDNAPGFYYYNSSLWTAISVPAAGSSDADWFVEGTTTAPTAITDDLFTQGNVAIGKNMANYRLDIIEDGTADQAVQIDYDATIAGMGQSQAVVLNVSPNGGVFHTGMKLNMDVEDGDFGYGMDVRLTSVNAPLQYGVFSYPQSTTGNNSAFQGRARGSGKNNGFSALIFDNGSLSANEQNGFFIEMQQATTETSIGTHNRFTSNTAGDTGTKYGVFNELGNDIKHPEGEMYGVYNQFNDQLVNTEDKYGAYTLIPSAIPGTHYGTYNDVQNAAGFAGYFIGNVSLGSTTSNRYTMPAADGAAGEVLMAAGDGTTSWAVAGVSTPSIINVNTSAFTLIPNTNTWTLIPFDTENIDLNSEFNTTTAQFTATTAGYYRVYSTLHVQGGDTIELGIFVGGVLSASSFRPATPSAFKSIQIEEILYLNITDTVTIQCKSNGSNTVYSGTLTANPRLTSLQIQKLN